MAIRTMTTGSGSGADFSTGWKDLLIKKAEYGDYNGKRYLDIWFEDYPDNMKTRVWEAINPKTKEEFRISNWFRFSQSGIQEVLDNGTGKPIITYDDDAILLEGMPINVYVHDEYSKKDDRYYARIWNEPAPTAGEGEHLTFTEKDVEYWKKSAEGGLKRWNERNASVTQSNEGNASTPPF
jgi:hypothetical protein|tara:strand:+ start:404 stop:946 length:543 start_codon:yes stop_codon:yes gene_type:complete